MYKFSLVSLDRRYGIIAYMVIIFMFSFFFFFKYLKGRVTGEIFHLLVDSLNTHNSQQCASLKPDSTQVSFVGGRDSHKLANKGEPSTEFPLQTVPEADQVTVSPLQGTDEGNEIENGATV